MKIALLHTSSPSRRIALNKDLNGGLGTADDYGPTLTGRVLSWLKWKLIALPVVSIAHLQAILKAQGHEVSYHEDEDPPAPFDVGLVYGSLVDERNENAYAAGLKARFPSARVGFWGPYPSRFPERFPAGDFVVAGEAEAFFLDGGAERLCGASGTVPFAGELDMNALPAPDYAGFPVGRYSYTPMLPRKPYLPLLASKGCPYPCGHYCSYGEYQGARHRQRSAEKVYGDMRHLRDAYGARSIQFRDPIFGLDRRFTRELCELLAERPLGVEWGMETRSDLLTEQLLETLRAAGLRSVNLGVETPDPRVAALNKRPLDDARHQEAIIAAAARRGIRVNAFFILGLEGDTLSGLDAASRYAVNLDTTTARFCVSTPYPGTRFFAELAAAGRVAHREGEAFTQFQLVHDHPVLSRSAVEAALLKAYRRFYFRPGWAARALLRAF